MTVLAHPITLLSACALTLVGCLLLYFSQLRALARLRAELAARQEAWAAEAAALRRSLQAMAQELEETRKQAQERLPPPRQSMNLSRRSQALRMHRLGESPEQIAAALGVSRTEVELLLKVHETVLESLRAGGAAAGA